MFLLLMLMFLLTLLAFLWTRKNSLPVVTKQLRLPWVVNAGIFSLAAGNIVWSYFTKTPEMFSDFTGGFIAMSALNKSAEYYAVYTGTGVFAAAFFLIAKLYSRFKDEESVGTVREISLYALIIPAVMVGQSFFSALFTVAFQVSAISVICGLIVVWCKNRFQKLKRREMQILLLGIFFGLASHFCIGLFCNRVCCSPDWAWVYWMAWLIALRLAWRRSLWEKFLVFTQCGLPFAFGNLLMPLQILRNGEIFVNGFNIYLNISVVILILCSFLMLYIAWRTPSGRLQKFIPSLPLAALLCLFCAQADQWGGLSFDDYHNGEIVLPWFLYQKFGCNIYVDYIPSRGIVNYVPGFLLWLFKGHDFSCIHYFVKWADFPLFLLALSILRRRSSLLIAFVGCAGMVFLTPMLGAGLLVGLCGWAWLSSPHWHKKPANMLALTFVTGLFGTFYSLTDTMPVYVSMLPLIMYMCCIAWQQERKKLLSVLAGAAASCIALILIPASRKIIFGICDVLFLQSGSYTTAHCVPLLKHNTTEFNIWYVMLNYGFLLLTAIFGIRLFCKADNVKSRINYFATASLVILGIILVQRAGGRASCEPNSRVLIASLLLLVLALPIWYCDWRRKKIPLQLVLVFCMISGMCGDYANRFHLLNEKYEGVLIEPEGTVNPDAAGLPHLGTNTVLDSAHFRHHQEVKAVVDSILTESKSCDGFWDLTNNSTIYAYCGEGLRPPMSYPSYFYVASVPLAKKMRKQVEAAAPVLVLIKGKNIEFHECTLALRSYPLYTYLVDNYKVFSDIYGKTWMIRKGKEELLKKSKFVKPDSLGDHDLLSKALDYRTIDGYPGSWGGSMMILRKKLDSPMRLISQQVDKKHILLSGNEEFGGEFLYLKFNREVASKWISVSWRDDFAGKGQPFMVFWGGRSEYLVPLAAASNWYLSKMRYNLIIQYDDQLPAEPLRLIDAVLFKRAASE